MPIDRKPVEDYFAELERKVNEKIEEIKTKILEALSEDSEKLYSLEELAEKTGIPTKPCRPEEDCGKSCECQENQEYFQQALRMLLGEGKIVAYPWPYPPTQTSQYFLGIWHKKGVKK